MNYRSLISDHHVAQLYDWLQESGSLFLRIERPHSGASGDSHVVSSLEELRTIISKEIRTELELFIFRKPIADEDLHTFLQREWTYRHRDEVLYVGVLRNQNYYERYSERPENYEKVIKSWFERKVEQ